MNESTQLVLNCLSEKCTDMGIQVSTDELNELGIFNTFISSHVRPNSAGSVSGMVLWAEWVRFYLKHIKTFPDLIFENEFRNLVISRFEFDIKDEKGCGSVYPGIEFVPEENNPTHVLDLSCARV
jgi:hypothetical protein